MSESETPHEPEPLQPRDSRLETFLRKAAPILAMERGVTKSASVKLRALATELRLPEPLFEQAVSDLGRDWAKRQLSRNEQQYVSFLQKELPAMPRQILTERLELRAVGIGEDKFQLSGERARELVRRVASELGFNRVSRSEAENYIRQLSAQILGGPETEEVKRDRLLEAAKSWGLTPADVEQIQRTARLEQRARQQARAQTPTRIALLVTLSLAVFATMLGWWYVQRQRPTRAGTSAAGEAARPASPPLSQPAWWDGPLYQLANRSAATSAAARNFAVAAASTDPATRRRAYLQLITGSPLDPKSGLGNELIVRSLLSEPDQGVLTQMLTTMLESCDEPGQVPTVSQYLVARNNLELWTLAGQQAATGQLPKGSAAAKLIGSLQEGESGLTQTIVAQRYLAAVAALAGQNPRAGATFLAEAPLPGDVLQSPGFSEALFAVLDADVDTWRLLRPVVTRLVATADRTALIPWLDWVDSQRNSEFAAFLADQIADNVKTRLPAGDLPEQRAHLQRLLIPPSAFEQNLEARRELLLERIRQLRKRSRSLETQPQTIANEAYLATLAWCWWCCRESGRNEFGPFDTLLQQNARDLGRGEAAERPGGSGLRQANRLATAVDRDTFLAGLARLDERDASDSARLQALQQLATVADRFADIDSADAQRISKYVVAAREQDLSEVEGALWAMRHWPTLVLTLFDAYEQETPEASRIAILLRALVPAAFPEASPGTPVVATAPIASQAVLNYLINGLNESIQAASGVQARPWGRLELYFTELAQTRAAMTELAFGRLGSSSTPVEVNRAQRSALETLLQRPGQANEAAATAQRRIELAWLENGSLPRAVLLERILVEWLAQQSHEGAARAQAIATQLDATTHLTDLLLETETNLVDLLSGERIPPR